jgi:FkbM family methyltransferase
MTVAGTDVYLSPPARIARAQIWGQTVLFTITNPNDAIQKSHLQGQFYEGEELEIIAKFVEPGAVFCDIGANIGNHSLFALKYLRISKAIVFEPNPAAIAVLLSNLTLNGVIDRCDTSRLGFGLSDTEASGFKMFVPQRNNLGGGRMVATEGEGSLDVFRGDDALVGQSVDFIKIDVEGMEMKVLAGLSETIAQQRPRIFVEVDRGNADDFNAWVERNCYSVKARFKRYRANENFMLIPKRRPRPAGSVTE